VTYPVAPLGVRIRAVLTTFDPIAAPSTWAWTDITSKIHHMRPIEDTIGASDDVSDTNTELAFVIKNDDGIATTDNPASTWWPYFDVGCPIEYAIDVGDGGGFDIQVIAYVTGVELEWPSGTQYRCLAAVTCGGYFARGSTAKDPPVYSPLRRTTGNSKRKGFWPFEDPAGTQAAASALPGGTPFVPYEGRQPFTFGATSLVPGAAAMATISAGQSMWCVLPSVTTATSVRYSCVFYASQAPAIQIDLFALLNGRGAGTNRYVVEIGPAGLRFRCYNASVTELSGSAVIGFAAHLTGPVWFELELTQNGANIDYVMREASWSIDPNTGASSVTAGQGGGSFAASLGGISAITLAEVGDCDNVTVGMFALTEPPWPPAGGLAAVMGWAGNTAAGRVAGMSGEFGIPYSVVSTAYGAVMGPQLVDSYEANMRDIQSTDHGVLSDHTGVTSYRTLQELYNLAPAITLTRTVRGQLAASLKAVRDDTAKANRVTLARPGGSAATVEDLDDILLHGTFERSPASANYATDYQLVAGAGWYLARGTATGQRFSEFQLNMRVGGEYTPTLPGLVATLQLGDRIAISAPPPQLPQNAIERQVRGRKQTVLNRGQEWLVSYQVVPTDAYDAFQLDVDRLDTSGTEVVGAGVSSSATLLVAATAGALPAIGAGLSIPLWAAGERVTLTAVAAEVATDPFTRSVSSSWGDFPATTNMAALTYGLVGTASDYNTTGTAGTISVPSAGVSRTTTLNRPMLDCDFTSYCTVPVLATGAAIEVEVGWRRNGTSTNYSARLNIAPSAAVSLQLYAPANGTPVVDMDTGLTHTAGATYGITVQTIGARHMIYVWLGTTTVGRAPNPHVDVIDTTRVETGYFAWRNGRAVGNTNAGAIVFSWDNIAFSNLQAFTLTRSVNSVVKALPVGSRIRLWDSRGMGV
jgi:hypothetical protein